jgi:hypothetical protein
MNGAVMLWTVLALNTNTGDYSLGSMTYPSQATCIKAISTSHVPDFPAPTIYQCVTISKKDYIDYRRSTDDWSRISSAIKKY